MSNFLCLATLLRKNNRKAKMSEEWNNNSNPVAVGTQILKDPRVKVNDTASRMIDVNNINVKQILFIADLTLSNPMSTIDKRISGFAYCLIVDVHPKYIFLKTLISIYFFYSLSCHIKGNYFL